MTSRSERLFAGLFRVRVACVLAVLTTGSGPLLAEEESAPPAPSHPYRRIPTRNVFGMKPPPTPAPVEAAPEPPKERPEFFLTGFTRRGGDLRAFIAYQPKGKPMEFPEALLEGVEVGLKNGEDLLGTVKLVGIDATGDAVEIEFNGERMTLDFEKNAMKASAGPASNPGSPGVPGANPNAPKGTLPPPPVPAFGSQLNPLLPGASGPTVVGRGGEVLGGFGGAGSGANSAVGLPAIQAGGSSIPGAITVPAIQAAPGQFGGLQADPVANSPRRMRVVEPPPFPSLPGNP